MTFSPVGSLVSATASTFSLTPSAIGDLICVEVVQAFDVPSKVASALSSSNVTWTFIGSYEGSTFEGSGALFTGKVTSASTATVTVTWTGGTPGDAIAIAAHEYSSTAGSWTVDTFGHIDSSGTNTWASLTPAGAGELYFGYAYSGSASAGSTSGYTYAIDSDSNCCAWNASCTSSAQAPQTGDSTESLGMMMLVKEVSTSLVVNTTSLPAAATGIAYSQTLSASNGTTPYTWSVSAGALPPWASLNSSTGAITGTPSAGQGGTTFTVQVADSASHTATQALTLGVNSQVTLVGTVGTASGTSSPLTAVYGQTPAAGHLLLALVSAGSTTAETPAISTSATGWSRLGSGTIGNSASAHVEVDAWVKAAIGGDTAPTFTQALSGSPELACYMLELAGANLATPLDVSGVFQSGSSTGTVTFTLSATPGNYGEFAADIMAMERATGTFAWTETGSGWTSGGKLPSGGAVISTQANYRAAPTPLSSLTDAGHFGTDSTAYGAGLIVLIAGQPVAAVNPSRGHPAGSRVMPAGGTTTPGVLARGRVAGFQAQAPSGTSTPANVNGTTGAITVAAPAGSIQTQAYTSSPGQFIRPPTRMPPRRGAGFTPSSGTAGTAVNGVIGTITVAAASGSVTAVTGSPGRVIKVLKPPAPGRRRGVSAGTLSTTVTGTAGTITVVSPAGTVQAVTGSPGRFIRSATRMPPRQARGAGSAGVISAGITVAGPAGIITVAGTGGTVQAWTGSPGRVVKPRTLTVPGRHQGMTRGTLAAVISGTAGAITVAAPAGTITAVTGSPGRTARSLTRNPPRRGTGAGLKGITGSGIIIVGPAGVITVTGTGGTVQGYTGSPGRTVRPRTFVPRKGSGHGAFSAVASAVTVSGVAGTITVTAPAGTVAAAAGSPGRVIRQHTRVPPARARYRFSAGARSTAIQGVTGTTVVAAPAGTVTAVTGSPGRRIKAPVHIPPGTGRGFRAVAPQRAIAISGVPGTIAVTAPAGTVSAIWKLSVQGKPARQVLKTPPRGTGRGHAGTAGCSVTVPAGTITIAGPDGAISSTVPGIPGTITVTGAGGYVTNVPARYVRWNIREEFAPSRWRSTVITGNAGLITVTAIPGAVAAASPLTGRITVAAPAGTVTAGSFAAPRYVRWEIRDGFAPSGLRSRIIAGTAGQITVTGIPGTVSTQYYVTGKANAAGRILKAAVRMPPRRGKGT